MRFAPMVAPCGGEHAAVKLRPVLEVVAQRQLRLGVDVASERLRQKRCEEPWEEQTRLHIILLIVLILIALKPRDGLKGRTPLQTERLAAVEYVAVLIGKRHRRAQVAGSVGTLGAEGYLVGLVHAYLCAAIEQRSVGQLTEPYVGIAHCRQPREVVVRALQRRRTVRPACLHGRIVAQHSVAQRYAQTVATDIVDGVYEIAAMICGHAVVIGTVLMHMHHHVHHAMSRRRGVGLKRNEILVELVVPVIVEQSGDTLALRIKQLHREPVALAYHGLTQSAILRHLPEVVIVIHRAETVDIIRL